MLSSIKTHGLKVMTRIPFKAILGCLCEEGEHKLVNLRYREANLIVPSGSENEQVSCFCR